MNGADAICEERDLTEREMERERLEEMTVSVKDEAQCLGVSSSNDCNKLVDDILTAIERQAALGLVMRYTHGKLTRNRRQMQDALAAQQRHNRTAALQQVCVVLVSHKCNNNRRY